LIKAEVVESVILGVKDFIHFGKQPTSFVVLFRAVPGNCLCDSGVFQSLKRGIMIDALMELGIIPLLGT
jgi:hypothetical protein